MKQIFKTLLLASTLAISSSAVYALDVKVGPLNVKSCTSGYPDSVKSPTFTVSKVPAGAKYLKFHLVDLDARSFNHGGGVVAYSGKTTIKAGAFNYLQPCPPMEPTVMSGRSQPNPSAAAEKSQKQNTALNTHRA